MESGKLLLEKVHNLIEKQNKPPPKLKPHEIFEMKKSKSLLKRKRRRRYKILKKFQPTKN